MEKRKLELIKTLEKLQKIVTKIFGIIVIAHAILLIIVLIIIFIKKHG